MQVQGAERIFYNGKIITLDGASTICSAIATRGDRILATGNDDLVRTAAHPMTEMIDLGGKVVIPGLVDGHAHMDREGLKDVYPSLAGAKSIDDVLARIAELVKKAPRGAWIVTMPIGQPPSYWDVPDNLAERRWPTRHDLDLVAPENPVYIRPIWGFWRHKLPLVSIANSCALDRCGINRNTPPPAPSVTIEKDCIRRPDRCVHRMDLHEHRRAHAHARSRRILAPGSRAGAAAVDGGLQRVRHDRRFRGTWRFR